MPAILSQPQRIAAILPHYRDHGDATQIITVEGETIIVEALVRTILTRLARRHGIDLDAIREKARQSTHGSILQPLALTPELSLCPLKFRTPRIRGDACTGYVNLHAIRSVQPAERQQHFCTVTFHSGANLNILAYAATVLKKLQKAQLAEDSAPYLLSCQHCRETPATYDPIPTASRPGKTCEICCKISFI